MADRNSPPAPSLNERRRASIAGVTFHELFGRPHNPGMNNNGSNGGGGGNNSSAAGSGSGSGSGGVSPHPGPITTAAAQASRRRLSLSTIGLAGSPTQASPFGVARPRGESISSAGSGSVDESPFEDESTGPGAGNPASPLARRMSFGARALRDVRAGNGGTGGNSMGEGFNFGENLRSRAERSSMSGNRPPFLGTMREEHAKRPAPPVEQPVRELPKSSRAPDAFQERILKGDFYMD